METKDHFTPLLSEIQRKFDAAIKESASPDRVLKLSAQSHAIQRMRYYYCLYMENLS